MYWGGVRQTSKLKFWNMRFPWQGQGQLTTGICSVLNLGRYDVGLRLRKLQLQLEICLPLGESLNPSALKYDSPRILRFGALMVSISLLDPINNEITLNFAMSASSPPVGLLNAAFPGRVITQNDTAEYETEKNTPW